LQTRRLKILIEYWFAPTLLRVESGGAIVLVVNQKYWWCGKDQ
jgi:hypothetical protein